MKPVFDPAVIRAAMQPSTSPIVSYVTVDDQPYSDSTLTAAIHKDGTITVVDERVVYERRR